MGFRGVHHGSTRSHGATPGVPRSRLLRVFRASVVTPNETGTPVGVPALPSLLAPPRLPPIVREGPIGLGHAVGVFLLLDRVPFALAGQDQLGRQPLRHGLFGPGPRERDEPAHGQGRAAVWPHLNRHLQRGTAHPAALYLERGLGVVDGLLEDRHPWLAGALLDQVHRRVEDALGHALLALEHEVVHELGDRLAVVARVRRHRPLHGLVAAAHYLAPLAAPPAVFGRLAPYLDRLWRRSLTPAESSVPRTI